MLQLTDISYSFTGTPFFLNKINMEVKPGNIYALTGPNGAGKTTLFNIITGYLRPLSGKIVFNGEKINGLKPYKINRRGIGRTFQDLRLISSQTVKENILLSMRLHPSDKWMQALVPARLYARQLQQMEKRADQILRDCSLYALKNQRAGEISFGEQKLLTIACCMANEASLILLDEPVAGLSRDSYQIIVNLLKQLQNTGISIVVIEHNKAFIDQTRAIPLVLKDGALIIHHQNEIC